MKLHPWLNRRALAWCALLALAACGGLSVAPEATPVGTSTLRPAVTAGSLPVIEAATATPPATVTPAPSPTPMPSATPVPSPTPDPAGVGLPCPAMPPVAPEYARYVLSVEPWPSPDPAAPPPPLSLADPLPAAARNPGYPYGSDGSGRYLLHNGLDVADEAGEPAVAVADGTVIIARDDVDELFGWRCDWYGQLVVLRLDETQGGQPVYALYGHVSDVRVSEGQRVRRGDPVAVQGSAGVAVVPHLHLEIRVGANTFGATRNPLLWLAPPAGGGVIAGRLVDPDGRAWQGVTVTLIDPTGEMDFLNTWTYLDDPDHLIRPDPALGENFVFGSVVAGTYDVYTSVQGVEYRQPIEVTDGALVTLEIVTEPYRTPTPEPSATP